MTCDVRLGCQMESVHRSGQCEESREVEANTEMIQSWIKTRWALNRREQKVICYHLYTTHLTDEGEHGDCRWHLAPSTEVTRLRNNTRLSHFNSLLLYKHTSGTTEEVWQYRRFLTKFTFIGFRTCHVPQISGPYQTQEDSPKLKPI